MLQTELPMYLIHSYELPHRGDGALFHFTKAAEARIILIDGRQLCKYMIQFNLGVSTRETIEIKTIDTDFFNFD